MRGTDEGLVCGWIVRGRVQGVGFRWFVQRSARVLGLTGWAKNLPDGSVQVAARGPAKALDSLREALESGPRWSRVDSVETVEIPHDGVTDKTFYCT